MKIIVFSDIHGNIQALEAMLKQAEDYGVEQFIFCGDIMGYFLHQDEVIDRLRQLSNLYAVSGNHDSYYIQTVAGSRERVAFAKKYGRSYLKELGNCRREYLKNLPKAMELQIEGRKVFVTHGSLEWYMEGRVYPDTEINADLYSRYDMIILGHTHYQMYRTIGNTVLLNPGSLGQPRDGKGYSYCFMDTEKKEFAFKTAAVDSQKLLDGLIFSGEDRQLIKYLKSKMEGVT